MLSERRVNERRACLGVAGSQLACRNEPWCRRKAVQQQLQQHSLEAWAHPRVCSRFLASIWLLTTVLSLAPLKSSMLNRAQS